MIFARSLLLTGGFPSACAFNGPACALNEAKRSLRCAAAARPPSAWARISMLDKFELSDEKLRNALDSSP